MLLTPAHSMRAAYLIQSGGTTAQRFVHIQKELCSQTEIPSHGLVQMPHRSSEYLKWGLMLLKN